MRATRTISRSLGLALGLAIALAGTIEQRTQAAAPRATSTVTTVMDWSSPWMGWAPFLVADARGYFRQEGINWKIIVPASVADPARILASGRADFAFTTILDVIEGRAQNFPIVGVGAYAQSNNWGIINWANSKLTPRDLKGKSIGIYQDAWSKTQLTIMLHHVGININQVTLRYAPSDVVPLLLAHKVDVITGITNAEQTEAEINGKRATRMYLASKYGVPNTYIQVLAANDTFLHGKPALARAWLRAVRKGIAYATSHPAETWRIFQHRYKDALAPDYGLKSWQNTIPLFTSPVTRTHGLLWQQPQVWQQTSKVLRVYKIIDRLVPTTQLFTNSYLH